MRSEKIDMLAKYVTDVNKSVKLLPEEEKRQSRNKLLQRVKTWDKAFNDVDKRMLSALEKAGETDYNTAKLPDITLERTIKKVDYTYTMTPDEYSRFVDDYLAKLKKSRTAVLKDAGSLSAQELSLALGDAKTEAGADVRAVYKERFKNKFVIKE